MRAARKILLKKRLKHAAKIYLKILAALLFALLEYNCAEAKSGAEGMCPLPSDYRVMMDGVAKQNSIHLFFNNAGFTTWKSIVPELLPGNTQANFTITEDEKHKFGFVAISSTGEKRFPLELAGGYDETTAKNYVDWMPRMSVYHPLEIDKSPAGNQMFGENYGWCYEFLGFRDQTKIRAAYDDPGNLAAAGFKWYGGQFEEDFNGWRVSDIHMAYHMDSPAMYGFLGNLGANPDEYVKYNGFVPFEFTYYVPSVPVWYAVSSILSVRWSWPYKYSHQWLIHHLDEDEDGYCDFCSVTISSEPYTYDQPYIYATPPRDCLKPTTDWAPGNFYYPGSKIQNPLAAEKRCASMLCFDRKGVPPIVYDNPIVKYTLPDQPVVIARSTVRVKDKGNIAHIQMGLENENTNRLKAECGKTISETMGDKTMVIKIVDNAVQANSIAITLNKEYKSPGGDWCNNNFKVTFWHEVPLYQYVSFQSGSSLAPDGAVKPLIDIAYSPMFVWKKKTWNTLSEFLSAADGSLFTETYTYRGDNIKEDTYSYDGTYIVYEKRIPLSKLFYEEKIKGEDIMPWHYASTSLGDMLGNPPYSQHDANTMYGSDFKDAEGVPVIGKFKHRPINFTHGKGPLKYFIEAHDGSLQEEITGCGKRTEEKGYNCGISSKKTEDAYIFENNYTQGLLKCNPEAVKYIPYSSSAPAISPDEPADPVKPHQPCLAEEYDQFSGVWKKNAKLLFNLNQNVARGSEVVNYFQAFGRIELIDKIRPNAGLKIVDASSGRVRYATRINGLSTLPFYDDLIIKKDQTWVLSEKANNYNILLMSKAKKPRPPFSLNAAGEEFWEFNDLDSLLKNSAGNRINPGRDFSIENGEKADSLEPYGTMEDKEFIITHQDLCDDLNKPGFASWYAYDNIDGQRLYRGPGEIRGEDWYKGVTSFDIDQNVEKTPAFPNNSIGRGYTSYKIIDETYPDSISNPVFIKTYKDGEYFRYPRTTFKNPNCEIDGGAQANSTTREVSVSYGIIDRAKNSRKFKIFFYIAPSNLNIQTIEAKEKRTN